MKVIFYTADWCAVCKSIYPLAEELCKELNIQLFHVDTSTEKGAEIAASKGVNLLPTIDLIGDKGELRDRLIGGIPKAKMKERFIEAMR
jgi:thiol-disulfide isomerase/thioredoxin